jgi:hypothetical protein
MSMKKRRSTVPKGYRLKPGTHRFIKTIQKEFNLSQEKVIKAAITLYYSYIKETKQERI